MIHRANPALRETDKVLDILADQNRTLAAWRRTPTAPSPRSRASAASVADFIVQANTTGEATAERSADIARGIERLPGLPARAAADAGGPRHAGRPEDAGAARPGQAAPGLGRLIKGLGTFSERRPGASPSWATRSRRAARPHPVAAADRKHVRRSRGQADPVARNLDKLTASLQRDGGRQRINDFLYYLMLATNGYDWVGHYLRAGLVANTCSNAAYGADGRHLRRLRHVPEAATAGRAPPRQRRPPSARRRRPAVRRKTSSAARAACSAAAERRRTARERQRERRAAAASARRALEGARARASRCSTTCSGGTMSRAPLARRADRQPGAGRAR